MRDNIDETVLRFATDKWGEDVQYHKAQEELGELQTAIGRWMNYDATADEMIDEIADVIIIVNQLAQIVGEEDVNDRVDFKMRRLMDRLSES